MLRYWVLLWRERQDGDPYNCRSVLPLPLDETPLGGGRFRRAVARRVTYPVRIRSRATGRIAHILDHSWADMLDYISGGMRKVITVHDLIPLRFPGELSPAQATRFRRIVSRIRCADAIVAVSEHTKSEVVDLLEVDPERIHVVPNGVNPPSDSIKEGRVARCLSGHRDSYLIGSLGSTLLRKNLGVFSESLRMFRRRSARRPVLVRAGAALPDSLRAEIEKVLGPECLVELGRVSDEELEEFYAKIDVMAVPSTYEGFGLPVIEAMARGVPVAAADRTSLPEVGGDAARYFDPGDPEAMADALAEIANSGEVAARMREEGVRRASLFSWRKTLEGFYDVYRALE